MMDERYFTQQLLDSEAMLYRIACTLLRNEEDRRDALQETALKAWRARGQLRNEQYFTTWLVRILMNECRSLSRKGARCVPLAQLPEPQAPAQDNDLRLLLDALPEMQRVPLVLHYLEGFSLEEIARVMRIPVGTAKYRLHQARKALRVELSGEEGAQ